MWENRRDGLKAARSRPAAGSPGVGQGLQWWQAGWRDRPKSHDGDLESRTGGQALGSVGQAVMHLV